MASKQSIKFYTTSIAVSQTVSEITSLLAKRGAQRVSVGLDGDGVANSLHFVLSTAYGPREFSLPARIDGVFAAIENDQSIPKAQRTRMKASRIAWRIAKDWLEVQFALVDAGMADLDEALFPYMLTGNSIDETAYTLYRSRQLEVES